jgi:hypothetical protein
LQGTITYGWPERPAGIFNLMPAFRFMPRFAIPTLLFSTAD